MLRERKNVFTMVDDFVLTIMKNEAGSGEGPAHPEQLYTIVYEDAHGETSVYVNTFDQLLQKSGLKYLEEKELKECIEKIKAL